MPEIIYENFFPNIKLEPMVKGIIHLYCLVEDVTYIYEGISTTVPKGFTYDGASIPKCFWWEIGTPFDPCFMQGALVHDYLYETHEQPKEYADRLLRDVLLSNGVDNLKATMIYEAVRCFGKKHYDNKTEWQAIYDKITSIF